MPYKKMNLNYFQKLEEVLTKEKYIAIYLNQKKKVKVALVMVSDNEIILESYEPKNKSNNILDMCLDIQKSLNDDKLLFPQFENRKTQRKALDNIVQYSNLEVCFYRLDNGYVLGTISRDVYGEKEDIFVAMNETIKSTFEDLDGLIYNKFGFYPNLGTHGRETLNEYIEKNFEGCSRKRVPRA